MPPILALWLGFGFIYWLVRVDRRTRSLGSSALWVPILWLLFVSTRPLSFWLEQLTGMRSGGTSNLEGNPVDLVFLLTLIISAVLVLSKRKFEWGAFVLRNKTLILLYGFLALSALWSPYPFPTFKRAMKDFGAVLVALVVLTEKEPIEEVKKVFVRLSYLLFSLSIIFIKYFPEIGRRPSRAGDNMFNGIAWHKSDLGALVFLFGLFIVVDLMAIRNTEATGRDQRLAIRIRYVLLAMAGWLMYTCGSVTSLLCFSLGAFVLWATGQFLRLKKPAPMFLASMVFLAFLGLVNMSFDISGTVIEALGKDPTLSGRTEIWDLVRKANTPALLGFGYYSFWSTQEAASIQEQFIVMNSAHNGFLDMYLDGGLIGAGLLILLVVVWGVRSARLMLARSPFGRAAFMIWVVAVVFNNSETTFFRLNPVWFTVLLMMIESPVAQRKVDFSMPRTLGRLHAQPRAKYQEVPQEVLK